MNEHSEAPTTIKEVGIHIGYMRNDIAELKDILKGHPTQKAFDELDERVTALETKNTLKNTLLWVGLVASAIINIVVIYQLFTER